MSDFAARVRAVWDEQGGKGAAACQCCPAGARGAFCSQFVLHSAVLNRLGDMGHGRDFGLGQVGDGEGDFEDAVVGPGREPQAGDRLVEQFG